MKPKRSKIENLKNLVEGVKKIPIKSRHNDDQSYSQLNESSFDFTPNDASNVHSEINDNYNKILDASAFETRTINERICHDVVEDEMLKNIDDKEILKVAFAKENMVEDNNAILNSQDNIKNAEFKAENNLEQIENDTENETHNKKLVNESQNEDNNNRSLDNNNRIDIKPPKPKLGNKKIPRNLPQPTRPRPKQHFAPKLANTNIATPQHPILFGEEDSTIKKNNDENKNEIVENHLNKDFIPEGSYELKQNGGEHENANNIKKEIDDQQSPNQNDNQLDRQNEELNLDENKNLQNNLIEKKEYNSIKNKSTDKEKEIKEAENEVAPIKNSDQLGLDNFKTSTNETQKKEEGNSAPKTENIIKSELNKTPDKVMELSEFISVKNSLITLKKELAETKNELNHYKKICHKYIHPDPKEEKNSFDEYETQIFELKEENEKLKEALTEVKLAKHKSLHEKHECNTTDTQYEDLIEELKKYYNKLFEENNIIISEKEKQIADLVNQNKQLLHRLKTDELNTNNFDHVFDLIKEQFDKINEKDNEQLNRLHAELHNLNSPIVDKNLDLDINPSVKLLGADDDTLKKAFEFIDYNEQNFDFRNIKEVPKKEEDNNIKDEEQSSVNTVVAETEDIDEHRFDNNVLNEEAIGEFRNADKNQQNTIKDDLEINSKENREIKDEDQPISAKNECEYKDNNNKMTEEKDLDTLEDKQELQVQTPDFMVELANKTEDKSLLDQVSNADVKNLDLNTKNENVGEELKTNNRPFKPLKKRKLKVTQMAIDQKLFDNEETEAKVNSVQNQVESPGISLNSYKTSNDNLRDKKLTNIFTQNKVPRPTKS